MTTGLASRGVANPDTRPGPSVAGPVAGAVAVAVAVAGGDGPAGSGAGGGGDRASMDAAACATSSPPRPASDLVEEEGLWDMDL